MQRKLGAGEGSSKKRKKKGGVDEVRCHGNALEDFKTALNSIKQHMT